MKKIFLILLGISILLSGTIFILYKNSEHKKEEVIDIFKDEEEVVEKEEQEEQEEEKIVVDIKGMVNNPGVYEVGSTARVNDVITLAGGLTDGADTSLINLAKIVEDEMTIIIYSKEEVTDKLKEEICVCECPLINNDACINNNSSPLEEDILININMATKEELMTISGIGEARANDIIKYREDNGYFKSIEEIKNVPGIGDSLFEKIKDYLTV